VRDGIINNQRGTSKMIQKKKGVECNGQQIPQKDKKGLEKKKEETGAERSFAGSRREKRGMGTHKDQRNLGRVPSQGTSMGKAFVFLGFLRID
jgi:hypothetical protein